MSQKDRNAIATQIDQLIGQAKASGNATYDGQYIFAGQKTDTAPYDPDGADTYQRRHRLDRPHDRPRLSASQVSVPGDGSDGKALQVLRDIATHLRGGTAARHGRAAHDRPAAIDASMADVSTARRGGRRALHPPHRLAARPAHRPQASPRRCEDVDTSIARRSRSCRASRPCTRPRCQATGPASASGRSWTSSVSTTTPGGRGRSRLSGPHASASSRFPPRR